MERVSDEWLDEAIPKYGAIDYKSKGANVYVALCELRERRQNEIKERQEIEKLKNEYLEKIDVLVKSFVTDHSASEKDGAGATHEREKAINEFWMKIEINCMNVPCSECPASDGDVCGFWEGTCGASLRKKYESIAGANVLLGNDTTEENTVRPIPCTKGFEDWTVKRWFAKINEELDEMKNAVLVPVGLDWRPDSERFAGTGVMEIAGEAADTITAITSMLEAMGIDEQQRQAAQKLVNEHNRQRGRC